MGTISQDTHHRTPESPPRWDRLERAALFEQSREWRTPGRSARQAATEIQVPRTTLPAWRRWPDTRDICPHGAECCQSGPGLAFLHRVVRGVHLVCVAVGACGLRLGCLWRTWTGLDRWGAAASGAPQRVTRWGEDVIGASRQDATARLAQAMPRKDIPVTQDATLPGGRGLGPLEPESNVMIVEQLAQAREHVLWNARLAPALEQRNGQGMQSPSNEAPGLLA